MLDMARPIYAVAVQIENGILGLCPTLSGLSFGSVNIVVRS
jgi:hypothetical protein